MELTRDYAMQLVRSKKAKRLYKIQVSSFEIKVKIMHCGVVKYYYEVVK